MTTATTGQGLRKHLMNYILAFIEMSIKNSPGFIKPKAIFQRTLFRGFRCSTVSIPLYMLNDSHAFQHRKHHCCSHDGADLATCVCSHRMHQEVIFWIIFLAFPLNHSCRHRIG